MKATRFFTLLLVFLGQAYLAHSTDITLLHVNDTHSHLDATGPKDASLAGTLGGIAKAATVIGTLRATEPNVLLLHAGDVFQGDPIFNTYFGVPEFMLMQQMGFDAMAVGNHEFDFGPGVLRNVLATAFANGSFPLVSANLDMSAFPDLQQWITPSIIKDVAGVKVGIFGMTVPNNPTNMPAPVIVRDDIVAVAQQAADALHAQGADVVICLSHLGIFYDRQVVESTTGIDIVVGGHNHFVFNEPVMVNNAAGASVPVLQAGEHYECIGELHFSYDQGHVTLGDYKMIHVDAAVAAEPSLQAAVEQIKAGVSAQFGDLYHTVVGTAASELTKRYDEASPLRDTPIGNLVADAFRDKTGTEIAITPLGLISEKIWQGPITGADVFRAMSYGYDPATGYGLQLATFDMSGAELIHGMEVGLSQLEISDDYFLQYSGVRFRYDPDKPVGERVDIPSIRINGKKLDPSHMYSVTVNTGVVMLLGSIGVQVENIRILPDFEYHVVRDYIASRGTINYHPQGRIREEQGAARLAEEDVPAAPGLATIFPNPVSSGTDISFNLNEASPVDIRIFDATGREVALVTNSEYSAGPHTLHWNKNNLAAGMYSCLLKAGKETDQKPLLIVK